jgi:hypothetical protein
MPHPGQTFTHSYTKKIRLRLYDVNRLLVVRGVVLRIRSAVFAPIMVIGFILTALVYCQGSLSNVDSETSSGPKSESSDFELIPQNIDPTVPQFDQNCFMLNPRWRGQFQHYPKYLSKTDFPDSISTGVCPSIDFHGCTGSNGIPDQDQPPSLCPMCRLGKARPCRIHGHYNWMAATYTGKLCFDDFSYPDMDYTFSFIPDDGAGLTRWNPPSLTGPNDQQIPRILHIEFDSRETVNRFRSDLWTEFANLASPCITKQPWQFKPVSCRWESARKYIQFKRAVVVGLVGLDAEHAVYSELHPVYAIAIEVKSEKDEQASDVEHSTWMIFARNTGDEGACSIHEHRLLRNGITGSAELVNRLVLLLPPPEDATVSGAEFEGGTQFFSNTGICPTATFGAIPDQHYRKSNKGVTMTFVLDNCDDSVSSCPPLVEGQVHIKWVGVSRSKAQSDFAKLGKDACFTSKAFERDERRSVRPPSSSQAIQFHSLLVTERALALTVRETPCSFLGPIANVPIPNTCSAPLTSIPKETESDGLGALKLNPFRVLSNYTQITSILNAP